MSINSNKKITDNADAQQTEIITNKSKKQKNKDKFITALPQNSNEESNYVQNKSSKKKKKKHKKSGNVSENINETVQHCTTKKSKHNTTETKSDIQVDAISNENYSEVSKFTNKRKHSESSIQNATEMKKKKKKKSHNKNIIDTSDGSKEIKLEAKTIPISKQLKNNTTNIDSNSKDILNSCPKGKNALKKERKKNKNKPLENTSASTNKHTIFENATKTETHSPEIKKHAIENAKKNKKVEKLKKMLAANVLPTENSPIKQEDFSKGKANKKETKTLRDKMMERLKGNILKMHS